MAAFSCKYITSKYSINHLILSVQNNAIIVKIRISGHSFLKSDTRISRQTCLIFYINQKEIVVDG